MSQRSAEDEELLISENVSTHHVPVRWGRIAMVMLSCGALSLLLAWTGTTPGLQGKERFSKLWTQGGFGNLGGFPGGGNQASEYRRQIANDPYKLPSWGEVMCRAVQDRKPYIVRQIARWHWNTLYAQCGFGWGPQNQYPLTEAIQRGYPDVALALLESRARPTGQDIVEAACSTNLWRQSGYGGGNSLLDMLLAAAPDVNAVYNGNTPLTCAAKQCNVDLANKLLSAGAYIEGADGDGSTPFLVALQSDCSSLANTFLQAHASISAINPSNGMNALQLASKSCMQGIASQLVQDGIPLNHTDNGGDTALITATKANCVPIVKSLLQNVYINANAENTEGMTSASYALRDERNSEVVNLLCQKGADANHATADGTTLLMMAAKYNNTAGSKILLQHSADVTQKDKSGNTALWIAASAGSDGVASAMLSSGARSLVNEKGQDGRTPLATAAWNSHPGVAKLLVQHGAAINIMDDTGNIPITLATEYRDHLDIGNHVVSYSTVDALSARLLKIGELMTVLSSVKADVNAKDADGNPPLVSILKFQKNQWGVPAQANSFADSVAKVAEQLLDAGANPNLAGQWDVTPLALCAYNGYPQTARLLIQKGANVNEKNAAGKTPLQLAGLGAGQGEVVQLLKQHGAH